MQYARSVSLWGLMSPYPTPQEQFKQQQSDGAVQQQHKWQSDGAVQQQHKWQSDGAGQQQHR